MYLRKIKIPCLGISTHVVCWARLGWSLPSRSSPCSAVPRTCGPRPQLFCLQWGRAGTAPGLAPSPTEPAGWGGQPEGGRHQGSWPKLPKATFGEGALVREAPVPPCNCDTLRPSFPRHGQNLLLVGKERVIDFSFFFCTVFAFLFL